MTTIRRKNSNLPSTPVTTATHSVVVDDNIIIAKTDDAAGNIAITLLSAATVGDGWPLTIIATGSAGVVNITGANINGEATTTISAPSSLTIASDGTDYILT